MNARDLASLLVYTHESVKTSELTTRTLAAVGQLLTEWPLSDGPMTSCHARDNDSCIRRTRGEYITHRHIEAAWPASLIHFILSGLSNSWICSLPAAGPYVKRIVHFVWLGGLVASALGMRTRRPRFESRVAPLFHWVATLGKLFTHIASPVSQLQETWVHKGVFGA